MRAMTHAPQGTHRTAPAPRRPRVRRLVAIAGLTAATLAVTACGSDADETATTQRPGTTLTVISRTAETATTGAGGLGTEDTDADATDADEVDTVPSSAAPAMPAAAGTVPTVAGLSGEEVASLLWMREEEKLALDVYTTLGQLWGVQIFDNIAGSEQNHTDAVRDLLGTYGITDPAATNPTGVFSDPVFQQLYDDLVARGSASLTAALGVGATIEDLDIVDLQERASDTAAIASVYAELEKGSRNHLRAFVSQLEAQGGSYTPQYLDLDAYTAIVTTATERGPAGR